MLGAAVLGLGRIGPTHARVVTASAGAELKAVADSDEAKLGALLDDMPGVAGHGDYRDALARDDVDVAIICLPHWLHEDAAVAAAEAGKHILIEKPLADSVAECDRIIAAAERSGVVLMPAHTQRYYPVVAKAKEVIDSGKLGDLIMAVDTWYKPLNPEARPKWMLDRERGGGMALMDGVHLIDRLLWIIGPDLHSVSGVVGNPVYPEIPADDMSMALLRWKSDKVASVSRIAFRTGITQYGADFFCTEGQLRLRIAYGQEGTTGLWIGQGEKQTQLDVAQFDSLGRQLEEFLGAVRSGSEPPITAAHGRQVIEVIEAIEHSSATGREVVF